MDNSPVLSWLPTILSLVASGIALFISIQGHRDRRRRDLVTDTKADTKTETGLTLLGWTLADRLTLEKRLVTIENEQDNQRELHDMLERMLAKVLHSPHTPALDRLLEKVMAGQELTDAEFMFLTDWIDEIANDPEIGTGKQGIASIFLALVNSNRKKQGNPPARAQRNH